MASGPEKIGIYSESTARRIADFVRQNESAGVTPRQQPARQFGGLRRPRAGGGGGIECDFELTTAMSETEAIGAADVLSCPQDPSLVGTSIIVRNLPESGGDYVFFGEIGATGRATLNPADNDQWWIENMECVPEETPLEVVNVSGTGTTAKTGTWRIAVGASGNW